MTTLTNKVVDEDPKARSALKLGQELLPTHLRVDEDPKARSALKHGSRSVYNRARPVDEDPKARSALKLVVLWKPSPIPKLMKTPKHEVH